MPSPLVTVVIPTRNRPELLERAVASVLGQENVDLAVHIADDASDEPASALARRLVASPRVTYFRNPVQRGAVANFAVALARVESPFWLLLGDDDYLLPDAIEILLTPLECHPQAILASGRVRFDDHRGHNLGFTPSWPHAGLIEPPAALKMFFSYSPPLFIGTLFRRDVLEKVAIEPESANLVDIDFILRAVTLGPMVRVDDICAVGGVHEGTASMQLTKTGELESWVALASRMVTWTTLSPQLADHVKARLRTVAWSAALGSLQAGDIALAKTQAQLLRDRRSLLRYAQLLAACKMARHSPALLRVVADCRRTFWSNCSGA